MYRGLSRCIYIYIDINTHTHIYIHIWNIGDYRNPFWESLLNKQQNGRTEDFDHCPYINPAKRKKSEIQY
jgi:hypothetical protein